MVWSYLQKYWNKIIMLVCFVSAVEINTKAINELYPSLSIGCFIKKPISIDYFVRRVKAELE
jgi:hypothetical protein